MRIAFISLLTVFQLWVGFSIGRHYPPPQPPACIVVVTGHVYQLKHCFIGEFDPDVPTNKYGHTE